MMASRRRGFTLVELTIVPVIGSMLLPMAAPKVAAAFRQRAVSGDPFVPAHPLTRSTVLRYGRASELHIDAAVGRFWVEVDMGGAGVRDRPATPKKPSLAERGKQVFSRSACINCHTIQGVSSAVRGPDLTHVGSRGTIAGGLFPNDSAHLASWIANASSLKANAIMTRLKPPLTDADIAALVAYLQSLK